MGRLIHSKAMVPAAAAALLFSARPTGFREKWTHLGSWFVKDAKGPGYAGLACGRWATASTRSTWRRTWAPIFR
jgi:hypothetical protein